MSSRNLLTESDPSRIRFDMTPTGERGIAPPGGNPNIGEEPHLVPLHSHPGFYTLFRTTQGFLGASEAREPTLLAAHWSPAHFAEFFSLSDPLNAPLSPSNVSSGLLKNPRGPITPKRLSDSLLLLLFYFNGATNYNSRNPYFLSAGIESSDRTIRWSQPELVLYDRNDPTERPGYPDLLLDPSGNGT